MEAIKNTFMASPPIAPTQVQPWDQELSLDFLSHFLPSTDTIRNSCDDCWPEAVYWE